MGLGLFYNDTVTLFNCFCDPDTEEEKCYLTLLENVNLVETKGANVTKSGMDSADAVKLYVDLEIPDSGAYEWAHDNLDSVYKITTVDKYEDVMPHFEIGGV